MKEEIAQWADIFPEVKAYPTKDRRVFQTKFERVSEGDGLLQGAKKKTYFACVVGGNCYGVDVLRPIAVNSLKECEEAYFKVKAAADYFEQNGTWPS